LIDTKSLKISSQEKNTYLKKPTEEDGEKTGANAETPESKMDPMVVTVTREFVFMI
jgi:hypothetical protein